MDQNKIGRFIAELRKEHGLTQKQLAEKLLITDKAVSKWECGNCMPDNSIMVSLCNILEISANELLSGERLSSTEYNRKAEENIMNLIKEREDIERMSWKQNLLRLGVLVVLIGFLVLIYMHTGECGLQVSYFFDFIALTLDIVLAAAMLIAAKRWKNFLSIFRLLVHKTVDEEERTRVKGAADFAAKAAIFAGSINAIIWVINLLRYVDNLAYLGPNLARIILSIFYSIIFAVLLLVAKERI